MRDKILITGADGFIGSHLVEALIRGGRNVRAFVYYNALGSRGWLDRVPADLRDAIDVVAGDVRDPMCVSDAAKKCHAIVHLAALIGVPYSYVAPRSYVDVNVTGTLNVVQAAREHGVAKVVHASTSEVYGTAQFVPISEDHPLVGQSPYAASKIGADQIALSYWRSFKTPVAVIRPFNTYGPRQSTRAVIPTVITQIAGGGGVVRVGATEPWRDFSFVSDVVRAMILALDSPDSVGRVINVGSGFEISIGDLVAMVAEIMSADVEVVPTEERMRPEESEVERLLADASLAKNLIGWEPEFSGRQGLEKGLKRTVEWFSDPDNLRHYRIAKYGI